MHINENGQLDWKPSNDGKESLVGKAAEIAKDVGGTTLKVAGAGLGAATLASTVGPGGVTAMTAGAGAMTAMYVSSELAKEQKDHGVASTDLESAKGGVPYEELMQQMASLGDLNIHGALHVNPNEEHITPGDFGQKQSRGFDGVTPRR